LTFLSASSVPAVEEGYEGDEEKEEEENSSNEDGRKICFY